MKLKNSVLVAIFMFFTLAAAITTNAQTLPEKVKSYLDKNRAGWKPSSVAIAAECDASFRSPVIVGDFDGNGKQDYAARITVGNVGFFIAFLEQKGDYKEHILSSVPVEEMKQYGMR